jgi:hypothetical protein
MPKEYGLEARQGGDSDVASVSLRMIQTVLCHSFVCYKIFRYSLEIPEAVYEMISVIWNEFTDNPAKTSTIRPRRYSSERSAIFSEKGIDNNFRNREK